MERQRERTNVCVSLCVIESVCLCVIWREKDSEYVRE